MQENKLKEEIKKELQKLEKMIQENKEKEEIETQRKKLDNLLKKYTSDL